MAPVAAGGGDGIEPLSGCWLPEAPENLAYQLPSFTVQWLKCIDDFIIEGSPERQLDDSNLIDTIWGGHRVLTDPNLLVIYIVAKIHSDVQLMMVTIMLIIKSRWD